MLIVKNLFTTELLGCREQLVENSSSQTFFAMFTSLGNIMSIHKPEKNRITLYIVISLGLYKVAVFHRVNTLATIMV